MPDWLFALIWIGIATSGFVRSFYRYRRHGYTRPPALWQWPVKQTPEMTRAFSHLELGIWGVFALGGIVALVVILAR